MKLKPFLSKSALIFLTLIYGATNVLFAYTPETNFWAQRKVGQFPLNPNFSSSFLVPRVEEPASPAGGRRTTSKTIYLIQDVHQNIEAQTDIGRILKRLIKNKEIDLVGLEGAFTEIDFSSYHNFPDESAVKETAQLLLDQNEISGPIWGALTTPQTQISFVGVDDKKLYQKNVDAYLNSRPSVQSQKEKLRLSKEGHQREKESTLNPNLLAFDRLVVLYRDGKIKMGDYVKNVGRRTADESLGPIEYFLSALELEESLDFAQVEQERSRLLNHLMKNLDEDETKALMEVSVSFRIGKINQGEFYGFLKNLCEKIRVPLQSYPSMNAYLQYVLLTESIEATKLLADIKSLESDTYARLIQTPEEAELIQTSERLHLQEKLIDFSLTSSEWKTYKTSKFDIRSFERFYEVAEKRDSAIATNLIRAMKNKKADTAALVVGGFHSQGLKDLFTKEGFTTISVTPKISKVETEKGSEYLSVFTQEKTDLENLFKGEKLFLAKAPFSLKSVLHADFRIPSLSFLKKSVPLQQIKIWLAQKRSLIQVEFEKVAPKIARVLAIRIDQTQQPQKFELMVGPVGINVVKSPLSWAALTGLVLLSLNWITVDWSVALMTGPFIVVALGATLVDRSILGFWRDIPKVSSPAEPLVRPTNLLEFIMGDPDDLPLDPLEEKRSVGDGSKKSSDGEEEDFLLNDTVQAAKLFSSIMKGVGKQKPEAGKSVYRYEVVEGVFRVNFSIYAFDPSEDNKFLKGRPYPFLASAQVYYKDKSEPFGGYLVKPVEGGYEQVEWYPNRYRERMVGLESLTRFKENVDSLDIHRVVGDSASLLNSATFSHPELHAAHVYYENLGDTSDDFGGMKLKKTYDWLVHLANGDISILPRDVVLYLRNYFTVPELAYVFFHYDHQLRERGIDIEAGLQYFFGRWNNSVPFTLLDLFKSINRKLGLTVNNNIPILSLRRFAEFMASMGFVERVTVFTERRQNKVGTFLLYLDLITDSGYDIVESVLAGKNNFTIFKELQSSVSPEKVTQMWTYIFITEIRRILGFPPSKKAIPSDALAEFYEAWEFLTQVLAERKKGRFYLKYLFEDDRRILTETFQIGNGNRAVKPVKLNLDTKQTLDKLRTIVSPDSDFRFVEENRGLIENLDSKNQREALSKRFPEGNNPPHPIKVMVKQLGFNNRQAFDQTLERGLRQLRVLIFSSEPRKETDPDYRAIQERRSNGSIYGLEKDQYYLLKRIYPADPRNAESVQEVAQDLGQHPQSVFAQLLTIFKKLGRGPPANQSTPLASVVFPALIGSAFYKSMESVPPDAVGLNPEFSLFHFIMVALLFLSSLPFLIATIRISDRPDRLIPPHWFLQAAKTDYQGVLKVFQSTETEKLEVLIDNLVEYLSGKPEDVVQQAERFLSQMEAEQGSIIVGAGDNQPSLFLAGAGYLLREAVYKVRFNEAEQEYKPNRREAGKIAGVGLQFLHFFKRLPPGSLQALQHAARAVQNIIPDFDPADMHITGATARTEIANRSNQSDTLEIGWPKALQIFFHGELLDYHELFETRTWSWNIPQDIEDGLARDLYANGMEAAFPQSFRNELAARYKPQGWTDMDLRQGLKWSTIAILRKTVRRWLDNKKIPTVGDLNYYINLARGIRPETPFHRELFRELDSFFKQMALAEKQKEDSYTKKKNELKNPVELLNWVLVNKSSLPRKQPRELRAMVSFVEAIETRGWDLRKVLVKNELLGEHDRYDTEHRPDLYKAFTSSENFLRFNMLSKFISQDQDPGLDVITVNRTRINYLFSNITLASARRAFLSLIRYHLKELGWDKEIDKRLGGESWVPVNIQDFTGAGPVRYLVTFRNWAEQVEERQLLIERDDSNQPNGVKLTDPEEIRSDTEIFFHNLFGFPRSLMRRSSDILDEIEGGGTLREPLEAIFDVNKVPADEINLEEKRPENEYEYDPKIIFEGKVRVLKSILEALRKTKEYREQIDPDVLLENTQSIDRVRNDLKVIDRKLFSNPIYIQQILDDLEGRDESLHVENLGDLLKDHQFLWDDMLSDTHGVHLEEVSTEISITDDSLLVAVKRSDIFQVMANLLSNAALAFIGVPMFTEGLVTISASKENGEVKLVVRDNGPGIDNDLLVDQKLFEGRVTSNGVGRGQGLAYVKKTVESWGGTIWADNHPDGGARFTIRIPAAIEEEREVDDIAQITRTILGHVNDAASNDYARESSEPKGHLVEANRQLNKLLSKLGVFPAPGEGVVVNILGGLDVLPAEYSQTLMVDNNTTPLADIHSLLGDINERFSVELPQDVIQENYMDHLKFKFDGKNTAEFIELLKSRLGSAYKDKSVVFLLKEVFFFYHLYLSNGGMDLKSALQANDEVFAIIQALAEAYPTSPLVIQEGNTFFDGMVYTLENDSDFVDIFPYLLPSGAYKNLVEADNTFGGIHDEHKKQEYDGHVLALTTAVHTHVYVRKEYAEQVISQLRPTGNPRRDSISAYKLVSQVTEVFPDFDSTGLISQDEWVDMKDDRDPEKARRILYVRRHLEKLGIPQTELDEIGLALGHPDTALSTPEDIYRRAILVYHLNHSGEVNPFLERHQIWLAEKINGIRKISQQVLTGGFEIIAEKDPTFVKKLMPQLLTSERMLITLLVISGGLPASGQGTVLSHLHGINDLLFEQTSGLGVDRRNGDEDDLIRVNDRFVELGFSMDTARIDKNKKTKTVNADFSNHSSLFERLDQEKVNPDVLYLNNTARYFIASPVNYGYISEKFARQNFKEYLTELIKGLEKRVPHLKIVILENSRELNVILDVMRDLGYVDTLPSRLTPAAYDHLKESGGFQFDPKILKKPDYLFSFSGRPLVFEKDVDIQDKPSHTFLNWMARGSQKLWEILKNMGAPFWSTALVTIFKEDQIREVRAQLTKNSWVIKFHSLLSGTNEEDYERKSFFHELIETIRFVPAYTFQARAIEDAVYEKLGSAFMYKLSQEFGMESEWREARKREVRFAAETHSVYAKQWLGRETIDETRRVLIWHFIASKYSDEFSGNLVPNNIPWDEYNEARAVVEDTLRKLPWLNFDPDNEPVEETMTWHHLLSLPAGLKGDNRVMAQKKKIELLEAQLKVKPFKYYVDSVSAPPDKPKKFSPETAMAEAETAMEQFKSDTARRAFVQKQDRLKQFPHLPRESDQLPVDVFPHHDGGKPVKLVIFDFDRTVSHGYPQELETLALATLYMKQRNREKPILTLKDFHKAQTSAIMAVLEQDLKNKRRLRGNKDNKMKLFKADLRKKMNYLFKHDPIFRESPIEHKVEHIMRYARDELHAEFESPLEDLKQMVWFQLQENKNLGEEIADAIELVEKALSGKIRDASTTKKIKFVKKMARQNYKGKKYYADRTDVKWLRDLVFEHMHSEEGEIQFGEAPLTPGFRELVEGLQKRGVMVALISNGSYSRIKDRLKRYDLEKYFESNVWARGRRNIPKNQRNKKGYIKLALKEFNVDPSHAVHFDDMPEGLTAANTNGLRSVGLAFSYSDLVTHLSGPDKSTPHMILSDGYTSQEIRNKIYSTLGLLPDLPKNGAYDTVRNGHSVLALVFASLVLSIIFLWITHLVSNGVISYEQVKEFILKLVFGASFLIPVLMVKDNSRKKRKKKNEGDEDVKAPASIPYEEIFFEIDFENSREQNIGRLEGLEEGLISSLAGVLVVVIGEIMAESVERGRKATPAIINEAFLKSKSEIVSIQTRINRISSAMHFLQEDKELFFGANRSNSPQCATCVASVQAFQMALDYFPPNSPFDIQPEIFDIDEEKGRVKHIYMSIGKGSFGGLEEDLAVDISAGQVGNLNAIHIAPLEEHKATIAQYDNEMGTSRDPLRQTALRHEKQVDQEFDHWVNHFRDVFPTEAKVNSIVDLPPDIHNQTGRMSQIVDFLTFLSTLYKRPMNIVKFRQLEKMLDDLNTETPLEKQEWDLLSLALYFQDFTGEDKKFRASLDDQLRALLRKFEPREEEEVEPVIPTEEVFEEVKSLIDLDENVETNINSIRYVISLLKEKITEIVADALGEVYDNISDEKEHTVLSLIQTAFSKRESELIKTLMALHDIGAALVLLRDNEDAYVDLYALQSRQCSLCEAIRPDVHKALELLDDEGIALKMRDEKIFNEEFNEEVHVYQVIEKGSFGSLDRDIAIDLTAGQFDEVEKIVVAYQDEYKPRLQKHVNTFFERGHPNYEKRIMNQSIAELMFKKLREWVSQVFAIWFMVVLTLPMIMKKQEYEHKSQLDPILHGIPLTNGLANLDQDAKGLQKNPVANFMSSNLSPKTFFLMIVPLLLVLGPMAAPTFADGISGLSLSLFSVKDFLISWGIFLGGPVFVLWFVSRRQHQAQQKSIGDLIFYLPSEPPPTLNQRLGIYKKLRRAA